MVKANRFGIAVGQGWTKVTRTARFSDGWAGQSCPPWVKTSLAPGSRVVTDYYQRSGLLPYLEKLRFNVVGYGCTTCIGNSGPLPTDVSKSIDEHGLVAVSVLSGNRNFEGRVNVDVRANYLMSPPLVVAFALELLTGPQ